MEMETGIIARARRTRRYRSPEERCRIVEETLVSGVSVATVAREHELNANLLFREFSASVRDAI
jgi:transposase